MKHIIFLLILVALLLGACAEYCQDNLQDSVFCSPFNSSPIEPTPTPAWLNDFQDLLNDYDSQSWLW